ncbi:MAG: 2-oxoglutarate dehydrogenase complex dihydrolipoyllysine-residue succinyltransferase [Nannocystis sp.]|nr:2-oxoglutarate dehydrogenase complex dihydrolipoyllysine-residue succinyltransferase [Nannocystis sp.]
MPTSITVPAIGESISEALIARWLKPVGASVERDEPLVELETDKVTVEIPAPVAGILSRQSAPQGATVAIGQAIGEIDAAASSLSQAAPNAPAVAPAPAPPGAPPPAVPSARAEAVRAGVDLDTVAGSGRGGRILKEDVQRVVASQTSSATPTPPTPTPVTQGPVPPVRVQEPQVGREEVVVMTPLRRRVAERLLAAQQTTASLTTFNEVDMSAVYRLRAAHKDRFQEVHGVKLGFMSFFVKAAVAALKEFRGLNAEVREESVVYKNYYNVGVAVGGGKGLVVPVIRDADRLGFAAIEKEIGRLAARARDSKLTLEDLGGGTFTISNGGIYGSMLSTPILNPPQTGILGLHNIVERPVVIDGKVEVRPVMYLALTYDHRLVDGREAVQFLVRVKQCIEAPDRLLLEI